MNWPILIFAPIFGAALIAGVAFLIARLVKGPLEIVAESSQLSDSENGLLFPRWSVWFYFLTYLAFLLLHFIWNRSFELPEQNWPAFATAAIVGVTGVVYYSCVLTSSKPGKFRRVTLLMTAVCAAATIVGVVTLILTSNLLKQKPNKASISTPDPWRVESITTIQPLTQKSESTLGQV